MSPFFVMSLLYGLTFGQTASLCAPSEYIIHVEKRECAFCLAINTTICAGFCMTRVQGVTLFWAVVAITAVTAKQVPVLPGKIVCKWSNLSQAKKSHYYHVFKLAFCQGMDEECQASGGIAGTRELLSLQSLLSQFVGSGWNRWEADDIQSFLFNVKDLGNSYSHYHYAS